MLCLIVVLVPSFEHAFQRCVVLLGLIVVLDLCLEPSPLVLVLLVLLYVQEDGDASLVRPVNFRFWHQKALLGGRLVFTAELVASEGNDISGFQVILVIILLSDFVCQNRPWIALALVKHLVPAKLDRLTIIIMFKVAIGYL